MPEEPYPPPDETDLHENVPLSPEPRRPRHRLLMAAAAMALAGALLGWWLANRPSPAQEAARSFVQATMSGHYRAIAPHLSRETVAGIGRGPNAKSVFVRQLQHYLTAGYTNPSSATFAVGDYESRGRSIERVEVILEDDTDPVLAHIRQLTPSFAHTWLVMVREDGEWKFDASRTIADMVLSRGYCEDNTCLKD